MWLAPNNTIDTYAFHQSGNRAANDIEPLAAQLVPDLAHAVDPTVLFEIHGESRGAGLHRGRRGSVGELDQTASPDDHSRWMGRSAARRRSARPHAHPDAHPGAHQ